MEPENISKTETAINIITIGTSAGGITAVSKLLATFSSNINAAIFIVIHLSKNSMTDVILNIIQKNSRLRCLIPEDKQPIENNLVYLAPADHHMILEKGIVNIKKGAFENHWRPSIDVLFRSAAVAYTSCVTGIILTGLLDDGTSGMHAIKRSGGLCIVQDPNEADFPDMPNSVLRTLEVDYKSTINEMSYILYDLYSRPECDNTNVPADIRFKAEITRVMSSNLEDLLKIGEPTSFTCPDCGGALTRYLNNVLPQYRCYTGHTFTQKILEDEQLTGIEESLWVAIRMMEERKNLFDMPDYETGELKYQKADQLQKHILRLRNMLMDLGRNT